MTEGVNISKLLRETLQDVIPGEGPETIEKIVTEFNLKTTHALGFRYGLSGEAYSLGSTHDEGEPA